MGPQLAHHSAPPHAVLISQGPLTAGCTHYTTTVAPGETRLYRIINAGTLMYQTVCFEQHPVKIVAADAYATQHFTTQCVDINAGQR